MMDRIEEKPRVSGQQTIIGNTVLSTISEMSLLAVSVYYILAARFLGDVEFGKFGAAAGLVGLFILFVIFGFFYSITKVIVRERNKAGVYVTNALFVQSILALFFFGLCFTVVSVLSDTYPSDVRAVIIVVYIAEVLKSYNLTLRASCKAMGFFKFDTIAMLIERFFLLFAGMAVLLMGYPLIVVAGVLAVARGISFILLMVFQYRMGLHVLRCPDLRVSLYLVRNSVEYVVQSIFLRIFDHIDVVMLTWMRPFWEVGWYNLGRRIFEGLWMIPNMITEATYPEINARHLVSKDLVFRLFDKAFKYMLVIAIIVSVGTVIIGRTLIDLLFGEDFKHTAAVLMILGTAIVPSYLQFFFGNTLIAINLQRRVIAMSIARSVLNILLNLIFIPLYGYIGATIATGTTELFSMVGYGVMMAGEGLVRRSQVGFILKLGFAALILSGTNLLFSSISPIIRFFMTIGLYGLLLWMLRVFSGEEVDTFKHFIAGRWQSLKHTFNRS